MLISTVFALCFFSLVSAQDYVHLYLENMEVGRVIMIANVDAKVSLLRDILDEKNFDAESDDLVILVGNFLSRDEQQAEAMVEFLNTQRRIISLMGITEHEYKYASQESIAKDFVQHLPYTIRIPKYNMVVVSTGLQANVDVNDQQPEDLMKLAYTPNQWRKDIHADYRLFYNVNPLNLPAYAHDDTPSITGLDPLSPVVLPDEVRDLTTTPSSLQATASTVSMPPSSLQATASTMFMLSIPFISIFIILAPCLFPVHRYFTYLWIVFLFYRSFLDPAPVNGAGRPFKPVRESKLLTTSAHYYPATSIQETELDQNQTYVFGIHPHGLISVGAWHTFMTDGTGFLSRNPGLKVSLATISLLFKIPIIREALLALGLIDASRGSLTKALVNKRSVGIMVGGAREVLHSEPGTYKLTLDCRQGFIKLAIRNGVPLVPVIIFGENDIWKIARQPEGSFLRAVQEMMVKQLTFAIPVVAGRPFPYKRPLTTVIGKPIPVKKNPRPSEHEINTLHQIFKDELKALFDKYKDEYDPERKSDLEIVE